MVEVFRDLKSAGEKWKEKNYEQLCGGKPDAISILARSVRAAGNVGRIRTGGYGPKDADIHGNIGGGHTGVIAARELKKYFPEAKIVTNSFIGARGDLPEERLAEVAAAELKRARIPEGDIIVQGESFSTLSELLETIRIAVENRWHQVVILVAGHQMARVTAMLEHIDTVHDPKKYREQAHIAPALAAFHTMQKNGEIIISLIASEDIVSRISPRHREVIDAARKSLLWQETAERDEGAAGEVRDGTYGKNPPPTGIR